MCNKKRIWKQFLVGFLFLLSINNGFAQAGKDGAFTVNTANTVLNRYTRVTADVLAGSNTVTVTNINELNSNVTYSGFSTNSGGFASNALQAGDLIMLYQAQGAVINTDNNMNYGTVTNYNGAGSYELAYVGSVSGNTITLSCNTRLSYYAARYVQVIRIPQYTTLTVTSPGTVVAVPWGAPLFGGADPSALDRRRGGFVGILANNIVNNGSINANQAGFRGGTIENSTATAGSAFYINFRTIDAAQSAEKGEGIAGYRTDYDALSGRYGRGAAANGGGGGNAHNAGGGGGANGGNPASWFRGAGVMNDFGTCGSPGAWTLDPNYIANGNALTTSSGGGSGGYTYSSANLDACTTGPSYPIGFIGTNNPAVDRLNTGWGGDNRDATGGLGGRPIVSSSMQSQIFLGGGGGAGDGNNSSNADGGDGGGIVFLVVSNGITGTGTIQSNGENGSNTSNTHNDAPGGGGGGGTVLIQANSIANTININANGGNGGNQLITGGEAEGPGGGGGGGVVSVNATTDSSTKTVSGGANGQSNSSSVTEFKANGATSGGAGSMSAITVNLNSYVCQTDLQINKAISNANPTVGDNVTFTITVRNNGANNATGVKVQDALPAGYTFESFLTSTGTWTAPEWNIGNLATGTTVTLSIVAKVNASGSYTNTATLSSDMYDPTTSNNTSSITPTSVNNPPTAVTRTDTTTFVSTDAAKTINPLQATDTDGSIADFTILSLPTHGTLALSGTAITAPRTITVAEASLLSYDPTGDYTGNDTFTFRARDNNGANSNTATITLTVGNNPPTAVTRTDTTTFVSTDAAKTINPLQATDTDGSIADFTILSLPTHGTLRMNGNPVVAPLTITVAEASLLTYDPTGDYTGNDTFTFRAKDNSGANSNTATITLTVGNNPPTANSATNTAVIASTATATGIDALTATDTDGTIATYTVVTLPSNGTLALGGTPVTLGQVLTPTEAGQLTYDPSGTFTGNDTFTFKATDNLGAESNTATVTIAVGNNAPTANTATNTAVIASTATATGIDALTATDTDGTIATYTVVTLPSSGTLALGGTPVTLGQVLTPTEAGQLTYDPSGSFTGNDTFTFKATDNLGAESNTATVTIAVGNNAPTANTATNTAVIASTATATAIDALTATDTDGTIATYTVVTLPSNGTLALGGTPVTLGQVLTPTEAGQLTYDPSGSFTGNDTFTFKATDNLGAESNTATVTIAVRNNAPTANTATNTAVIASTATATAIDALTATDTDGTIATYTVVTLPSNGTLALGGTPVTLGQVLTPTEAGQLTYDPSGSFTGNDTFTFKATDNLGAESNTATVTIAVGNNAPTANTATNTAVIASTATATGIDALTATDTDGTIATYTVVTLPSNGTLALGGTPVTLGQVLTPTEAGQLTYDPSGSFTGNDTFTFKATDNLGAESNTATVTIAVGNNAPTANSATNTAVIASTATATGIDALTATDTDGTIATYTVVTLPSNGTLALGGTAVTLGQVLTPTEAGQLTYDPSGSFTGNDTFTFKATDNLGAESNTATITIAVGNNAPTANTATNTAVITSTATATGIDALTATDTDGTIATYTVVTLPSNGTLALGGTAVTVGQVLTPTEAGQLTYDPSGSFTGNDTFTFKATDNLGAESNTATVTIAVGNNAPTANTATNTAVIASTATATGIDALTATDTDGTIATYTVVTLPSNGTLALGGTAVTVGQVLTPTEAGQLTYDPSGSFTGNDTFTFKATDNLGAESNTATVTIAVGNNAPTANTATNTAVIASTATATGIDALTATDTDGTIATYTVVTLPSNGTLALGGTAVTVGQVLTPTEAGQLTYDPSGSFTGNDTFTFKATDNLGAESNTATITIAVGNNAPTANTATNTAVIASTATATAIDALTATDTDGTIATYTVVTLPSNGTLALGGTPVTLRQVLTPTEAGQLTYDPSGSFTGNDTFTFKATDNLGAESNTATVTIAVGNNAPTANTATNTAVIASTATATGIDALTATDTDGSIATYTVVTLPSNGTLALGGTPVTLGQVLTPTEAGQLTYDPSGSFTGNDTFTFKATDNLGAESNTATITIAVGNNAPTANTATNTAVIASTATATGIDALTATDTDGTIATYTVVTLPSNGTLALGGTPVTLGQLLTPAEAGQLTYDPSGSFTGNDTFTFKATDNLGAESNTATVTIAVGNNAPTANSATNTAVIASTATATGIDALTAIDTDGTIATYTVVTLPSNGTLALGGTPVTLGQVLTLTEAGQLTYDPSGSFTGNDTFTFKATDNLGAESNTATVTIAVGNNAPTANSATNTAVIASTAMATGIDALTATDTDGTIATYTVVTLPSNGTLALGGTPVTLGQVLTPTEAGQLTYDPSGSFTGNDTFTFKATDNLGAESNTATVTIAVGNNAPTANDDTNNGIASSAGATPIKALTGSDIDGTIVNYVILTLPAHGTLAVNGAALTAGQVLTPVQAANLTYDPNGTFSGNDSFTFTVTDNDGAVDATPGTIVIPVIKRELVAVKDEIGAVVGINEVVKVINVLENDTLDNNPLTASDVTITVLTPDPNNVLTLQPDGTVELAPNAPAGNYTLTYEICEKVNSGNCTSATVSVTVVAPTMTITADSYCADNTAYVSYSVTANNFTPTGSLTINWIDSANNVVLTQTNMPLSGNVLWPGTVVDANNRPIDWPGWVLTNGQWQEGNDGFELTRPAVTMQFSLNPTQSVVVNYPSATSGCNARPQFGIEAGNDNEIVRADGINGSLEVINVLDNDKLNGVPVKSEDVILTGSNFPAGITLNADGTIDVAPGTAGGNHTLTYQICERANSNNCSTATVTIFVEVPALTLVMEVVFNDLNGNGNVEAGETLTYTFTVKNTGNVPLNNVSISNLLPGVVLNGGPINLAAGESDTTTFTGTYTLTQADINAGSVSNQATVTGTTQSGISVEDKSDSKDADSDNPTVIEFNGCEIKIYNAVSLNGDNLNERFYIRGIECYPENTVQIYNRWGVLVFEREHYNNNDVVFKGYSEGRTTVKESNGLPEGTYYYILKYTDNQSRPKQEAGYLYLTK